MRWLYRLHLGMCIGDVHLGVCIWEVHVGMCIWGCAFGDVHLGMCMNHLPSACKRHITDLLMQAALAQLMNA